MSKRSWILGGILCSAFNVAAAQSFETGDAGTDAAIERLYSEVKQKAAADAAEFALEKLAEEALLDAAKPILRKLGKASKTSPLTDLFLNASPTARFDELPMPGGDVPEIFSKNEFDQMLQDTGIDTAAFARNYDLYAPGGLAKYNADLRRLLMQEFIQSRNNDGRLRYLAVEAINYDRLHLEQLAASEPISEEAMPNDGQGQTSNTDGSSCVATEDELGTYFAGVYGGVGFASNNAVIAASEAPTTEVINRDPFTYRLRDAELCAGLGKASEQDTMPPLSKAAQNLIDQHISEGCQGRGGEFGAGGIIIHDLDGDNLDDLILDDGWISCQGNPQSSISCGARACEISIYLRRGQLLQEEFRYLAVGVKVEAGNLPTISGQAHNLSPYSLGWNGSTFSNR